MSAGQFAGRLFGPLDESAERELWILLDALDSACKTKGLPGMRQSPEADDANFLTLCNVDDARGWLDDLEARCGVDVAGVRAAYEEWIIDYQHNLLPPQCTF